MSFSFKLSFRGVSPNRRMAKYEYDNFNRVQWRYVLFWEATKTASPNSFGFIGTPFSKWNGKSWQLLEHHLLNCEVCSIKTSVSVCLTKHILSRIYKVVFALTFSRGYPWLPNGKIRIARVTEQIGIYPCFEGYQKHSNRSISKSQLRPKGAKCSCQLLEHRIRKCATHFVMRRLPDVAVKRIRLHADGVDFRLIQTHLYFTCRFHGVTPNCQVAKYEYDKSNVVGWMGIVECICLVSRGVQKESKETFPVSRN